MTVRYIFIRGLPGFTVIFPYYLINGTIFDENLLNIKYVLILYTIFFFCKISHSRKN